MARFSRCKPRDGSRSILLMARTTVRAERTCRAWIKMAATLLLVQGSLRAQPATQPVTPRPTAALTTVPDGTPIGHVRFTGLANVDEGFLLSLIRTHAGDPYRAGIATEDIDRLLRTGKFDDVSATVGMQDGRATVTFAVIERQVVVSLEIVGNQKFKTKELVTDTGLPLGSAISEYTIKKARDALERKYKEAGYYYVRVEVDVEALRAGRVVLTVSEGPRVRVRHVVFEGNTAYTAFALRGKVETKT